MMHLPHLLQKNVAEDAAGVLSWVHIGDLHITRDGEQNHRDLKKIVGIINRVFKSIGFVFLPGDVAEKGDAAAYAIARDEMERLEAPWCAILGDHDVHTESFDHFLSGFWPKKYYAFATDKVSFMALHLFDTPHPASFSIGTQQLQWLEEHLMQATLKGQMPVLLQHCYPSDLKVGSKELHDLIHKYGVGLVEMGHTHYNEIANDGRTIYTATRSTGQIEEGPVGFSVTNIDHGVISWRFFELDPLPAVMITSPGDERLTTEVRPAPGSTELRVRAKVWSDCAISRVTATIDGEEIDMERVADSQVWEGTPGRPHADGVRTLQVKAMDKNGREAGDMIRFRAAGTSTPPVRQGRDQDNAIAAWPEHGILGTQLGPNKNGRKW